MNEKPWKCDGLLSVFFCESDILTTMHDMIVKYDQQDIILNDCAILKPFQPGTSSLTRAQTQSNTTKHPTQHSTESKALTKAPTYVS